MAIFHNRPLACACLLLIFAVVGGFLLSFWAGVILCAVLAVVFLAICVLAGLRGFSYIRLLLLLLTLGACLGLGRVLWDRYRADRLFGEKVGECVSAAFVVEKIDTRTTYGSRLLVRLIELEDEPCRIRAILVTEALTPLYIGDRVAGEFLCSELREHSYYEGQESQYVASGAYVALSPENESELTLIESGNGSFAAAIADLRDSLHYRVTKLVAGEKGELFAALLLDTKSTLDDSTVLDFRRSGLSHLLALSGLHLMILATVIDKTLALLRVGKRWRIVCLLLFGFGYLVLTGCSFSMLRAVFMLTLLQLAFLLKGDHDGFTALCLGGAIMVLFAPGAVFDLSFQMTMLATFGILAFGELQGRLTRLIPKRRGVRDIPFYILRTVLTSLLITLFASIAVLPVQWLVFGELSLLAPLANLLMILFVTPALVLGMLLLIFSAVPGISFVLSILAGVPVQCMLLICDQLSPFDGMLSLRYDFVPYVLIPLWVLTALLLICDLKKYKILVLAPTALAVIAFAVCLGIGIRMGEDEMELIYRNKGQNEGILLVQNGTAVICDLSNGSKTQLYSDYKLLQAKCATEVEVLMLTHYHERQVAALSHFSGAVLVRALWVPEPDDDAEQAILADLLTIALREEIAVTVYKRGTTLTVFDTGKLCLSESLWNERSTEPAFRLEISFGETALRYESATYSEYAREQGIKDSVTDADYLILGSHGPVPHDLISPAGLKAVKEIWITGQDVLLWHQPRSDKRYLLFPEVVMLTFR